jgi:phosphoglycerol transferase MdoB-like AlkP superfamily enzyme
MLLMGVNLVLVSVTHWLRFTFLLSGVFVLLLGTANYFVDAFRGYGIVYMDLFAVKTAANVAGNYSYQWDWHLFLGAFLGIVFLVLCVVVTPAGKRRKNLRSWFVSLIGLAAGVGFFVWVDFGYDFLGDVNNLTWDHSIGISEYGYLLYVTANAGEATVQEPEGYSVEKAEEILSRYEDSLQTNSVLASHAGNAVSPNIIMVMNESFSDLSVLGNFNTSEPYLSFFNSLKENTIRGYANSSVYGGYTANSEFEFLTGCTKAFLPGSAYLQYIDNYMPSLVTNITAQEGYSSAVAVHPYNPSGYNRNRVYPLLGFERFLSLDDFVNPVKVRKYVSDESDYEMLEKLYEEKKQGESLCLFNVTMQNHSSYDYSGYTFENPVKLESIALQPEAEQYLSLVKMSDDALKQLITYFKEVKEPVLLVVFGDHQPHLPDYFYKHIMGKLPDDLEGEDAMKRYLVPFIIWANYDIQEAEIEKISLNYLSTLMMETAGLELTDFQKFLLDMYQYVPSVSAQGYYDNKGVLHGWDETDNDVIQWIREYRILQYNYMFDTSNRLEEHFQVKGNEDE